MDDFLDPTCGIEEALNIFNKESDSIEECKLPSLNTLSIDEKLNIIIDKLDILLKNNNKTSLPSLSVCDKINAALSMVNEAIKNHKIVLSGFPDLEESIVTTIKMIREDRINEYMT